MELVDRPGDDDLGLVASPRMASRIDKMLAAGRITEEEADRVRAAAESGDLGTAVNEIRARHVREWVAHQVQAGHLSQADADEVLERAERGEDPGSIRSALRRRHE